MSKNLTRKGLALGAVVALGTSLFAGAPAHAAAALVLEPNAGTSYNVLASDTFEIKVFGTEYDGLANTSTALRWKVTRPSETAAASYELSGSTNGVKRAVTRATFSDLAVDILVPDSTGISATAGRNTLTINPTTSSTSATQVYKVQAYIDSNGTTGLQAGEFASVEKTINFVTGLTPTLTLNPVGVGNVTGTVSYGADFNYNQTDRTNNTLIKWTKNGSEIAGTSTTTVRADDAALEFVSSTGFAASGDIISAVAKTVRYDGDTTYAISASATGSVATATAAYKTVTVTQGANLAPEYAGANTEFVLRKGTTSFSYGIQFFKDSAKAKPVAAGQSVAIAINEVSTTLVDGDVIKVNGTAVPVDGSGAKTIFALTDADGKVTVSVTSALGSALDEISIDATSGTVTTDPFLFKWVAATLDALKEVNSPITGLAAITRTIVRGGTLPVSYALVDQFGEKWTSANTATTYRLNVALKATESGSNTWSAVRADFVGGVASATITDESTSALDGYRVSVTVLRNQDGTSSFAADSIAGLDVKLKPVSAAATPSKITLKEARTTGALVSDTDGAATNSATRSTTRLSAIDRRVNVWAQNSLGLDSAHAVHITGVVNRADGGTAAGVAVTLAATGVWFSTSNTGDVYVSNGTITTVTNEAGVYDVYAFSNAGGTKSVVITSGAATATQKIKWAAAAAADGSAITITAPAYTAAGRTVDVSVLLTDKYGAPVTSTSASPLRVSVTGAGSNTTIAADSDADGLVSFKLIFGANETGSAVVKATYDAANDGTVDLTVTKTIVIGTAPAAAATAAVSGSTGKFYVSATAAAGKLVVVKVAGKFVTSFKATGSKKSVAVKATKGSKKVTVFVGGKLAATKTVTVK